MSDLPKHILKTLNIAYAITDQALLIRCYNSALAALFELPVAMLNGHPISLVFPEIIGIENDLPLLVEPGRPHVIPTIHREDPSGQSRYFDLYISEPANEEPGWLITAVDITYQAEIEQRLRQERNELRQEQRHIQRREITLQEENIALTRLSPRNLDEGTPGTILIVDDNEINLKLLETILTNHGYKIYAADNGQMALDTAARLLPDLVLLDIMMPGLSGYEVCQHLKDNELTKDIPVIFISALDSAADKVASFTAGGVDYVTKPFQGAEVLARVKNHLTLNRLKQQLEQQVEDLDAFTRTVAHDLKNPLNIISLYLELLQESGEVNEPTEKYIGRIEQSTTHMLTIIDELLLFARIQRTAVHPEVLKMGNLIGETIDRFQPIIENERATIITPEQWPAALGYAPWIKEVWANYLSNALKYGGQPPLIELGATPIKEHKIRFWIRDNGPGLSAEQQKSLFTEFNRLGEQQKEGHGLGLAIVWRIMQKLNGIVGIESKPGQGSTFYFELPAAQESSQPADEQKAHE